MKDTLLIISMTIILTACTSMNQQQATTTELLDSSGNVVQRTVVSSESAVTDAAMYEAVSDCYRSQSAAPQMPQGLTANEQMMFMLMQSQAETTMALAQGLTGNKPCDLGMNGNESRVAIESEYSKRWNGAFGLGKWIAGGYFGSEIASSLLEKVGGVIVNG